MTIDLPTVSVRRGGITYPRPGTPEAAEKARQYEADRAAYERRQTEREGTVTGHVWLAQKDNGYEGTYLIEVCSTEARARTACEAFADGVRGPHTLDWADADEAPGAGVDQENGDRYTVRQAEVRA